MPPFRHPYSDDFDEVSAKTVIKFDPREDKTRQELKDDADINKLLARYSPYELPAKEAFYGDVDYDVDAVDALNQTRELREWFYAQPVEFQAKFGTAEAFLQASPEELASYTAGKEGASPPTEPAEPPKAES